MSRLIERITAKWRRKRFGLFRDLMANQKPPFRVLDIGGTQRFWETVAQGEGFFEDFEITLVNIVPENVTLPNFRSVSGDARDLREFDDDQFDIVFSNSVIEHVGEWPSQRLMANEVQRLGRRYFLQTPSYGFPLEPHFFTLGFHWLPV